MAIYARPGRMMAGQLAGDAALVAVAAVAAAAGRGLYRAIERLANPVVESARLAGQVASQMQQAQDKLQSVPGIGGALGSPFGSLRDGLAQVQSQGQQQVLQVHHVATVTGWVVFLLPVVLACAYWLPRRLRFVRDARLASRFIDAAPDLDLFALRAMANLPMHEIARISPDPVGSWRAGDTQVIEALARQELARHGIALKRSRPNS